MQSATEAINSLEVTLRGLVRVVMGETFASLDDKLREELDKRLAEEIRRRDGAFVTRDLLAYTHIYELRDIIHKNWEKFKPALKDKKRFDVYMDRVADFRNVPMHSRSLLPFEATLLSGISGEFRNLVTIYRSEQDTDAKFYPVVESISDSLGTEVDITRQDLTITPLRLQVGDEVQFLCRAWDAQDRALTWTLTHAIYPAELDRQIGADVTLTWRVTEEHVGSISGVTIFLRSNGKYHKMPQWDARCGISYSVEPPIE